MPGEGPRHLMDVARKWFEGKDLTVEAIESKVVVSQEEFKTGLTSAQVQVKVQVQQKQEPTTQVPVPAQTLVAAVPYPALQEIVNAYWAVLLRLIGEDIIRISGAIIVKPPTIYAVNSDKAVGGYYDPSDHSISMNHTSKQMESASVAIERLIKSPIDVAAKALREDPALDEILASAVPVPVIIHELLHAIRAQSHTGIQSHNDYTVTIDEIEQTHCFDYAALAIYKSILSRGLLQELRGAH